MAIRSTTSNNLPALVSASYITSCSLCLQEVVDVWFESNGYLQLIDITILQLFFKILQCSMYRILSKRYKKAPILIGAF